MLYMLRPQLLIRRFLVRSGLLEISGVFYDRKLKKKKLDLVVIRINKLGELRDSGPCHSCIELMKMIGVRKIHFSTGKNDEIKSIKLQDFTDFHISLGEAVLIYYNMTGTHNTREALKHRQKIYEERLKNR